MSCDNCLNSPAGQAVELANAIKKATDYAKEKKISMAVYQEAGEFRICEAFQAISSGYPITKVVSYHNTITA